MAAGGAGGGWPEALEAGCSAGSGPLCHSLQQECLQLDRLKTQLSEAIQRYGAVQKVSAGGRAGLAPLDTHCGVSSLGRAGTALSPTAEGGPALWVLDSAAAGVTAGTL